MTTQKMTIVLLTLSLVALPACRTNPNRSPGGTVFGSTAGGAGLGALIGLAAGDAGAGAAIGAGVGLIAGAIQADEDARARDDLAYQEPPERHVIIERRVERRNNDDYADRQNLAREYLARAQRAADLDTSVRLLKRSLREYRTPEAHTALGEIFEIQGNEPRAINEYQRALDLDEEYRPARDKLSRLGR